VERAGGRAIRRAGSDEQNNIEIYKGAHAAVVNITSTVYERNWFLELIPQKGTGSGFLVDDSGRILTNNHVISGSQELEVTLTDQTSTGRTRWCGIRTTTSR